MRAARACYSSVLLAASSLDTWIAVASALPVQHQSSSANDISAMLNSKPLPAFLARWRGSSKAKSIHFEHIKSGPLADARENVKRVHRQVANFEQSCEWHELDEGHPTKRIVWGFFNAVRHHERALTGFSEDNVEAMDALERESNHLVAAASTLYAIDPALYQVKVGVSLLAGVRGLDSKEAFERYLADLEMIAEDRRERAAWLKERREEGYTDRQGKEHSPAEIASKKERDDAGRADPMARRRSDGGRGLQDEESTRTSMRSLQDRKAEEARRNPHRLRDAINAAHKERNAPPPPLGAERRVGGYAVRSDIAGELENPPTWDLAETRRRVAHCRAENNVPERPQNETARHVYEVDSGWQAKPPQGLWKRLNVKNRLLYCPETRSFHFPDEAEAVAAYEKFMAQSRSDVERKAMMRPPREAFICAHCGIGFLDQRQSTGVRLTSRQNHERRFCAERSSSSEEEESDEDESEEEEPEEAVEPPPPKRVRFCEWWPWGS